MLLPFIFIRITPYPTPDFQLLGLQSQVLYDSYEYSLQNQIKLIFIKGAQFCFRAACVCTKLFIYLILPKIEAELNRKVRGYRTESQMIVMKIRAKI